MKKLKPIPKFKNEDEEREFWSKVDSTEYIDYSKAVKAVFPNLKPSTRPITLRLPENLVHKIKLEAHKIDIPYQSLIKQVLYREFAV